MFLILSQEEIAIAIRQETIMSLLSGRWEMMKTNIRISNSLPKQLKLPFLSPLTMD